MKKVLYSLRGLRFLIALLVLFIIVNGACEWFRPVSNLGVFRKNDFEKSTSLHPGNTYRDILFGNSVVISSFIEDDSVSGYLNFGIDYGKISDLLGMLTCRGGITVTDNIVIGLNYFVFMDTLPTNPSYVWHKKPYEPYLYFERDRLSGFFMNTFTNIISGNHPYMNRYKSLSKELYFGNLTDDELDLKIDGYRRDYWGMDLSGFSQNLTDLMKLIDLCGSRSIRLRAVWMPYNPYSPLPDIYVAVMNEANSIFDAGGIEVYDMTDIFQRGMFYDLGHFDYENGAPAFTKEIDKWLIN